LLSFSDICEAEADTLLSCCGVKAAKISAGGTVGCSTSTQVGSGDTLLQTNIDVENPPCFLRKPWVFHISLPQGVYVYIYGEVS
jgi:hypothetical protein